MAQLLENDEDNGNRNIDPESIPCRQKGKIIHCSEVENSSGVLTLNGEIKILNDNNDDNNNNNNNISNEIFFYAPIKLQLESNDLVSFDISSYDNNQPIATNIKIIKYGGTRYDAHIEALTKDILQCSVFNDNKSIDVTVDSQHCINAVPDSLCHGSQIEFSLIHDERSNLWTAKRIILLNNKKENNINNNLFDIELTNDNNNGQKHDNNIMDSINNENENENKIDTNDRYLIANNSADIIWI
eukprot:474607_1